MPFQQFVIYCTASHVKSLLKPVLDDKFRDLRSSKEMPMKKIMIPIAEHQKRATLTWSVALRGKLGSREYQPLLVQTN